MNLSRRGLLKGILGLPVVAALGRQALPESNLETRFPHVAHLPETTFTEMSFTTGTVDIMIFAEYSFGESTSGDWSYRVFKTSS